MQRQSSIFLLSLLFFCSTIFAQVGPYSWVDHLGLDQSNTLARFNGKIYASNYNGIILLDETEGSATRMNKINGLHDVNIRLLRVNEVTQKLLVIYENSNIDVISTDNTIKNFPDIKIKSVSGKKAINEVFFNGKYAYLATGLGIIVFDTEKMEIRDTYVIGNGGMNLEVNQVTMNDSLIFAATPNGLRYANHKTRILNNYANWKVVNTIPNGYYCGVTKVQDIIIAAYSPSKLSPGQEIDTLYSLVNNIWSRYTGLNDKNIFRKFTHVYGNYFGVIALYGPMVLDVNTKQVVNYFSTFNGNDIDPQDFMFYPDKNNNLTYWMSDRRWGLYQTYGAHPWAVQTQKGINGMRRRFISNIDIFKGEVAVSPSYPNEGGGTDLVVEGINHYRNNQWEYFESKDLNNNLIFDINNVYFDRKDPSRIWASSWSSGLLEYRDHQLTAVYNASNSALTEIFAGNVRVGGLCMDKDGNLWMANSDVKEYVVVRKANGNWQKFNCEAARFSRKMFVDKNNTVWVLHERDAGLTVLKHNNFQTFQYRNLTKDANNGNLGSNSVYSIAEDKDGKIWIGTAEGIRVFYNPSNVFNSSGFDAEPIKIIQDGNVELLLEKEIVTSIKVDGANNKWVGTQTGGLYCFNSDGQKQLYHFTKENSPLYSNNVVDLNYDEKTGDIYIGTDLGLQSFRSSIIEGEENCNSMYAFPNPVRPNYTGNVFIRGIMDESVVKITDESGNLVWEVKSQGGQVEWNKKTLSGEAVRSGVYIAYAMSTNGELRCLTKILLVN